MSSIKVNQKSGRPIPCFIKGLEHDDVFSAEDLRRTLRETELAELTGELVCNKRTDSWVINTVIERGDDEAKGLLPTLPLKPTCLDERAIWERIKGKKGEDIDWERLYSNKSASLRPLDAAFRKQT